MPRDKHTDCIFLLDELAETSDEGEIKELVWQALICAYLDHPLWRDVAEAVFAKHGYTPEEIRQHNDGRDPVRGDCWCGDLHSEHPLSTTTEPTVPENADFVCCDHCGEVVTVRGFQEPEWVHATGSVFCMTTLATVNGSHDPRQFDGPGLISEGEDG